MATRPSNISPQDVGWDKQSAVPPRAGGNLFRGAHMFTEATDVCQRNCSGHFFGGPPRRNHGRSWNSRCSLSRRNSAQAPRHISSRGWPRELGYRGAVGTREAAPRVKNLLSRDGRGLRRGGVGPALSARGTGVTDQGGGICRGNHCQRRRPTGSDLRPPTL